MRLKGILYTFQLRHGRIKSGQKLTRRSGDRHINFFRKVFSKLIGSVHRNYHDWVERSLDEASYVFGKWSFRALC